MTWRGIIKIPFQHFPGAIAENHENRQTGYPVSGLIRIRESVNHPTAVLFA
jgi:hypothetical protein